MSDQPPPEFCTVVKPGDKWAVSGEVLVVVDSSYAARLIGRGGVEVEITCDVPAFNGPSIHEILSHVQYEPTIKPEKKRIDRDKPWRRWPVRK